MLSARQRFGIFGIGTIVGFAVFFLMEQLGMQGTMQFTLLALFSAVIPSILVNHLHDDDEVEQVRND